MPVKKTIAIVGATEKEGKSLSEKLAKSQHHLLLVSENPEKLSSFRESLKEKIPGADVDSIQCVKDGCWEADIILLAVPENEEKTIGKLMKEVATQKIVGTVLPPACEHSELQKLLPYSRLVNLEIDYDSDRIKVSGNNVDANKEISNIFIESGFQLQ
jgi:predicted dinucleotide-binding enzyme